MSVRRPDRDQVPGPHPAADQRPGYAPHPFAQLTVTDDRPARLCYSHGTAKPGRRRIHGRRNGPDHHVIASQHRPPANTVQQPAPSNGQGPPPGKQVLGWELPVGEPTPKAPSRPTGGLPRSGPWARLTLAVQSADVTPASTVTAVPGAGPREAGGGASRKQTRRRLPARDDLVRVHFSDPLKQRKPLPLNQHPGRSPPARTRPTALPSGSARPRGGATPEARSATPAAKGEKRWSRQA